MDENKKNFCPLTKENCRNDCGWFSLFYERCAITDMAESVSHIVGSEGILDNTNDLVRNISDNLKKIATQGINTYEQNN